MTTTDNPDWRAEALCAQVGGDIWFPPKGASVTAARNICAMRKVPTECLTDALQEDRQHGIRAGMTERERRQMKQIAIELTVKGAA